MVRLGMVAMALALAAAPLVAQESNESLKKELEQLRREVDGMKADRATQKEVPASMAPEGDSPLMTALKGVKFSGFVDTGYVVHSNGLHGEDTGGNPVRAFDALDNSFYLNAVQLNFERLASKDMIVGFHVELAGGHDPEIYDGASVSIQEGWVQILAPVGSGLDIRVGKQATLIGYEVIESMNNFNYSRGLLWFNAQPVTATGVRAAYSINEMITVTAGINNGLNATTKYEDNNHNKVFEMQVAVKSGDLSVYVNLNAGSEGTSGGAPGVGDKFYIFDVIGQYVMGKMTFALEIEQASAQVGANSFPLSGFAAYFKYQTSDSMSEAVRFEYFSDKDGALFNPVVPGEDGGTGARFIEVTLTHEMRVASQLIFRIELRFDNSNQHTFSRDGKAAKGDSSLGFEAIMPF